MEKSKESTPLSDFILSLLREYQFDIKKIENLAAFKQAQFELIDNIEQALNQFLANKNNKALITLCHLTIANLDKAIHGWQGIENLEKKDEILEKLSRWSQILKENAISNPDKINFFILFSFS